MHNPDVCWKNTLSSRKAPGDDVFQLDICCLLCLGESVLGRDVGCNVGNILLDMDFFIGGSGYSVAKMRKFRGSSCDLRILR